MWQSMHWNALIVEAKCSEVQNVICTQKLHSFNVINESILQGFSCKVIITHSDKFCRTQMHLGMFTILQVQWWTSLSFKAPKALIHVTEGSCLVYVEVYIKTKYIDATLYIGWDIQLHMFKLNHHCSSQEVYLVTC